MDLHQGEERHSEMPLDTTVIPTILVDQEHLGSSQSIRLHSMLDIPLKERGPIQPFQSTSQEKSRGDQPQ